MDNENNKTGGAESTGTKPTGAEGAGAESPKSFDDMLKDNKDYQAELDRRITKALETAKIKWDKDAEDKLTEARKLEKMNAEQKADYQRKQLDEQLKAREAAITRRELAASAKETLMEKGLPPQLADVLDYSSAENCNNSIASVEQAFKTAVSKSVADKLRGQPPKAGGTPAEKKEPSSIADALRMRQTQKG